MDKEDIKNFTLEELEEIMPRLKEPSYRASQIFFWLYQKGVNSFEKMPNLPKVFMEKLSSRFFIGCLTLSEHLKSSEGAEKFLFKLLDRNFIETVLIRAGKRKTICLSTQVGCKFRCQFCASGKMGFTRNLSASEIVNQVLFLSHNLKHEITNYVFMGMGEPLDNYENTAKAVLIMNNPKGLAIGSRRITISTCGVIPGIKKLTKLGLEVNLSISLHAVTDKLRNELIPINKRYPLEELIKTCKQYVYKMGRIITLEYVLIKDKNHSEEDARGLIAIAKRLKAKVNLITCSTIPGMDSGPPAPQDIRLFMRKLIDKKIEVTLRKSKGADIQAACGQLAGRTDI